MAVMRIVMNIATDRIDAGRAFYTDVMGLDVVMDHGWIMTFADDGICDAAHQHRQRRRIRRAGSRHFGRAR